MCKTKIYRSGHLFWLVWLGQAPHNKHMFNAWMWSLFCQCSYPSAWRAWCPLHIAEALGTTLGMERLVQAVHIGLLSCICSSGSPTDVFSGHASTAATTLMFTSRLLKESCQEKPTRSWERLGKQDSNWQSWAVLQGAQLSEWNPEAPPQKHWCYTRLGRRAGCWERIQQSLQSRHLSERTSSLQQRPT